MQVHVDPSSGFCFGVAKAVKMAEEEISVAGNLSCLGEIVHNPAEVKRLQDKGLVSIRNSDLPNSKNKTILFRAHGEPPDSYKHAKDLEMKIIDATCPVVFSLQKKVKLACSKTEKNGGQVVIFGKKGHPEINGLTGHSGGKAIIISALSDVSLLNFAKPVILFSQTTANIYDFDLIAAAIREKMSVHFPDETIPLEINNTICKRVTNRVPELEIFAKNHQVIIFVGGKNSSNGRFLFDICKKNNERSYLVEDEKELDPLWFENIEKVGISGATSTPTWQLERIANRISAMANKL